MKKILAVVFGVLLVALAVPAFAATDVTFKGAFVLQHLNHDNFQRAWDRADVRGDNDSWYRHRLQLNVTFQATEDIKVVWQFRAPWWGNWGAGGIGARNAMETTHAYAEVTQPWGTVQFGRLADGSPGLVGGLATLGHEPSWGGPLYAGGGVFDAWNDFSDGVNYNIQLDNGFGFAAYYYKMDNSGTTTTVDDDVERFGIEPRYIWDGGGASLGFVWVTNKAHWFDGFVTFSTQNEEAFPFMDYDELADYVTAAANLQNTYSDDIFLSWIDVEDDYTFVINPAFTHSWGPFSVGFEAAFAWGKTKYLASLWADSDNNDIYELYMLPFDIDKRGFGLYADAVYNYGAGDISFVAWYADGTNWGDWDQSEDKFEDAIGMGDFSPFLVAFGYNGVNAGLNSQSLNNWAYQSNSIFPGYDDGLGVDSAIDNLMGGGSNQWGLGLLGNHSITDDISFNWGIGYFALVEPYYWYDDADHWGGNPNKDLGWEIDLGARFQLLDNLRFETQFGYFFNGDAFDTWTEDVNGVRTWHNAKDTFAWFNALSVSF